MERYNAGKNESIDALLAIMTYGDNTLDEVNMTLESYHRETQ